VACVLCFREWPNKAKDELRIYIYIYICTHQRGEIADTELWIVASARTIATSFCNFLQC
jgi:hypothetical protein